MAGFSTTTEVMPDEDARPTQPRMQVGAFALREPLAAQMARFENMKHTQPERLEETIKWGQRLVNMASTGDLDSLRSEIENRVVPNTADSVHVHDAHNDEAVHTASGGGAGRLSGLSLSEPIAASASAASRSVAGADEYGSASIGYRGSGQAPEGPGWTCIADGVYVQLDKTTGENPYFTCAAESTRPRDASSCEVTVDVTGSRNVRLEHSSRSLAGAGTEAGAVAESKDSGKDSVVVPSSTLIATIVLAPGERKPIAVGRAVNTAKPFYVQPKIMLRELEVERSPPPPPSHSSSSSSAPSMTSPSGSPDGQPTVAVVVPVGQSADNATTPASASASEGGATQRQGSAARVASAGGAPPSDHCDASWDTARGGPMLLHWHTVQMLLLAGTNGHVHIVRFLVENGAPLNEVARLCHFALLRTTL